MPESWHILGAGAIGCLFADTLAARELDVTLVLRDPADASTRVTLERDGVVSERSFAATGASAETPIDRLLVTTKAYDVVSAVASITHRLTDDAQLVLLTNGLGYLDDVARLAPSASLYCATTTEGVFRQERRQFRHAGRGRTLVGSPRGTPPPAWFSAWETSFLGCTWTDNIERALWHKLAINCAINPLTAIHQCRNGELATRPSLRREVHLLCAEIAAISVAAGFADTAASIERDAISVIEQTADNRSSMLQDTLAGRPTEISYITGHLLATASAHNLDAPHNAALLEQLSHA